MSIYLEQIFDFLKSRQTPDTARKALSGTFPYFPNKSHTGRHTAKQGVFSLLFVLLCELLLLLYRCFFDPPYMSAFDIRKFIIGGESTRRYSLFYAAQILIRLYKPRQTLDTARTALSGTFPSFRNKSHTGRHTAKQGEKTSLSKTTQRGGQLRIQDFLRGDDTYIFRAGACRYSADCSDVTECFAGKHGNDIRGLFHSRLHAAE